jgi:hypothetical protein
MWLPSSRVGVRNSGFRQGTASAVPLVRFLSPVGAGLAPPGVNAGKLNVAAGPLSSIFPSLFNCAIT